MPQPLKVWLVANNSPFPGGQEGRLVRDGIRRRLANWFGQVARHANARTGRPAAMNGRITVQWSSAATPASATNVGDYDIVVYFSPSAATAAGASQTVERNAYLTAARGLRNAQLRTQLVSRITSGTRAGGITRRASVGNRQLPTLSEAFVLYDAQFSNLQMRVNKNAQTFAVVALHEAAHNKATNSSTLHSTGGGGAFGQFYSGQPVNPRNIAFLAQHIWNWRPQYIQGQPLTPRQQQAPARPSTPARPQIPAQP